MGMPIMGCNGECSVSAKADGFYGLTPMACIPKPIIWFLCFNGKDFTNQPVWFNPISLISKSRVGNVNGTFSLLTIYPPYLRLLYISLKSISRSILKKGHTLYPPPEGGDFMPVYDKGHKDKRDCRKRIKRISRNKFIEDTTAILDARRIFIDSNVTRNITVAYELYQEVLAEKEIELKTQNEPKTQNSKLRTSIICPECGSNNVIRVKPCGRFEGHEFCEDCNYQTFF